MSNPRVIEIVRDFLSENGYDGLYEPETECGCRLKDLAPCGQIGEDRKAGYLQKMSSPDSEDFYIVPIRPENKHGR